MFFFKKFQLLNSAYIVHQSVLFNHNWNKFQDGNSLMKYRFNSPGGKYLIESH